MISQEFFFYFLFLFLFAFPLTLILRTWALYIKYILIYSAFV